MSLDTSKRSNTTELYFLESYSNELSKPIAKKLASLPRFLVNFNVKSSIPIPFVALKNEAGEKEATTGKTVYTYIAKFNRELTEEEIRDWKLIRCGFSSGFYDPS